MPSKSCEKCAAVFSCGIDGEYWCARLPAVGDPAAGDCLCPACMKAMVVERIQQAVQQFEADKITNPAAPYLGQTQAQSLIEGIDYQIEAGGLLVFTAWYHLKRGHCCGSRCRHCPYGHVNVPASARP
jgi:hypothetical protein